MKSLGGSSGFETGQSNHPLHLFFFDVVAYKKKEVLMPKAQDFSFYCDECDARFSGELQANIDIFEWSELIDQDICIYCIDDVKSQILLEREGQVYEPTEYTEWMDFDPHC